MPVRSRPTLPRRIGVLLATVPVLAVGVADLTIAARMNSASAPSHRAAARSQRPVQASAVPSVAARAGAIRSLLDRRARAVLDHDGSAFLATDDPMQPRFRAAQAREFAALSQVPLANWSYEAETTLGLPIPPALTRRYAAPLFAPLQFALHYRLRGFDAAATNLPQYPTFVRRGTQWYVASFSDFASSGNVSAVDIWDFGPVRVVHAPHVLVLGHPSSLALMRQVAHEAEAAIPRVSAVWGGHWARRVVILVPSTEHELGELVDDAGSLKQIAAVASAEVQDCPGRPNPTGDRVGINPRNWSKLSALGRRVVLTHELTHVATRAETGSCTPTWLVEGFADYVGYLGTGVPTPVVAQELARDVRRGAVPRALPRTSDFAGASRRLAQAYEGGWMACRLIASTWGQRALVDFYVAVGTSSRSPDAAVAAAMSSLLHTTPAAFVLRWRQYLRDQLS